MYGVYEYNVQDVCMVFFYVKSPTVMMCLAKQKKLRGVIQGSALRIQSETLGLSSTPAWI